MKVRAFRAGEDEPPNITTDQIPTHEPEGDKSPKVRAFRAGEDLIGRLAIVKATSAPTYVCPSPGLWFKAKMVPPGTIVTILERGDVQKARGAEPIKVAIPEGHIGWIWLDHLDPV